MLWFKKQPKDVQVTERDLIVPAELTLPFDANLFQQHFSNLKHVAEQDAGLDAYIASMQSKQKLYAESLNEAAIDSLSLEKIEVLLELVFTARRRVYPVLQKMGEQQSVLLIKTLLYGNGMLLERMQSFTEALPVDEGADKAGQKLAAKIKRAAFDFAAEMLHYTDPVKYPLMSRWVWDQSTVSGALREFIRGNDHMAEVPLGNSPEMFEGARKWLAEQVAEQGIYKDVPFWVDMVLADAYSTYFRSMAEGMLSADFGRSGGPEEYVKKFLGIDTMRRSGRTRVKKDSEVQVTN